MQQGGVEDPVSNVQFGASDRARGWGAETERQRDPTESQRPTEAKIDRQKKRDNI